MIEILITLKSIAQPNAVPLNMIFGVSLDHGKMSMDWKVTTITPVHKIGPKQSPSNYELVNFTGVLVEILERVMKMITITFMETRNLLNSEHRFV